MQAAGQQAGEFFKAVTGAALAFFAVLAGGRGLVDFTRETVMSNAALYRLSKNLDESSTELFAWKRVVEQAGGDGNAFVGTVTSLSAAITNFKVTGDIGNLRFFQAMGIGIANADGSAKKSTDLLLELADRIEQKKINRTDAFNLAKSAGIDEGTINVLFKGRDALQSLLDVQRRKAIADEEAFNKSENLREAWTKLKQKGDDLMRSLLEKAMPTLEKLVGWLDKLLEWCEENPETVAIVIAGITAAIVALGVAAVAALVPLLALAAPFIVLAAKIALVTAAVVWLVQALKEMFESEAFQWWSKTQHAQDMTHNTNATEGGESIGIDPEAYGIKRQPAAAPQATRPGKTAAPTASVASREAVIRDKLEKDGYTPAQIAGVIGSLKQENGTLNPSTVNSIGMTGIAQWDGKRRKDFARLFKHDIRQSTIEEQADFMVWELKNTEKRAGNAIRGARTPGEAASLHSDLYERAGAHEKNNSRRIRLANESYMRNGGDALPQPTADAASAGSAVQPQASNTTNRTTNIGTVVVKTAATDAKGIVRDMRGELSSQADTGMS